MREVRVDSTFVSGVRRGPMYQHCLASMTRLKTPITAMLISGDRVKIVGALNNGVGQTVMVQPPPLIGGDPVPVSHLQLADSSVWEDIVGQLK